MTNDILNKNVAIDMLPVIILVCVFLFVPLLLWIIAEVRWSQRFRLLWGGVCIVVLIHIIYGLHQSVERNTAFHHLIIHQVKEKLLENKVNDVICAIEEYESSYRKTKSEKESLLVFYKIIRKPSSFSPSVESPQNENEDSEAETN